MAGVLPHHDRWIELARRCLGGDAADVLGAALLRLHRARLVLAGTVAEIWRAARRLVHCFPRRDDQVFLWSACGFALRCAVCFDRVLIPSSLPTCLHLFAVLWCVRRAGSLCAVLSASLIPELVL